MSELKAGVIKTPHDEGMSFNRDSCHVAVTEGETEFYLKSEADKVIAKLNNRIQFLQVTHFACCNHCNECADGMGKVFDETLDELKKQKKFILEHATDVIRRQKYKRCLNMANWCFTRSNFFFVVGRSEGGRFAEERFRRSNLYSKWHKRWLKIAEQFKEDK